MESHSLKDKGVDNMEDKKEPVQCTTCNDSLEVEVCTECCSHEWENGMCIGCGRDDYHNFVNEDEGQDR